MNIGFSYHVYVNGAPTTGLHDTLEEDQADAMDQLPADKLEIETVNGPVFTWFYDQNEKCWVKRV